MSEELIELIIKYFDEGYSYKEICQLLKEKHKIVIYVRKLKRLLFKLGLRRKNVPDDLEKASSAILNEIEESGSCLGYRSMKMRLKIGYKPINIKRDSVLKLMHIIDPEGIENRSRRRLRRRKYNGIGPDRLHHIDGYDKLKPYGFSIHGCIDGFSRFVLWLELCTTNKDPYVIAYFYLQNLKRTGLAAQILRVDKGTENVVIIALQEAFRRNDTDQFAGSKSFIQGKSTANQRIESFWGRMRQHSINFWIDLFKLLWEENFVDDTNEIEMELFRYCFGPLIVYDLERTRQEWNLHTIRKQHRTVTGKPNHMYYCPEAYNTKNYGKRVSQEEVDIALEKYTSIPKYCDPLIVELAKLLLPDHETPTSVKEALLLCDMLLSKIRSHANEENNS